MLQRSRDALASLCKLGYKEDHPVFVAARDDVEQEKLRVRLFAFLAASGALGVGERTSRRGRPGFCYPLHLAVEANDPGAVAALLWGGADRRLVDSDGLTALDLAREVDDRGSHAAVIAALLRAPPARAP
ncbi:unnamed protein product [Prorocentrum cordatum]|uniref:Ankyrin repeat domain-containing protein n=1 Tax=Prorocentrum cordatum TaxID=2364126 RepID=A0ABN9TP99_9DINO|nr:unnamed protein product [Polarella glacialis]